jgi:hypothetical protein
MIKRLAGAWNTGTLLLPLALAEQQERVFQETGLARQIKSTELGYQYLSSDGYPVCSLSDTPDGTPGSLLVSLADRQKIVRPQGLAGLGLKAPLPRCVGARKRFFLPDTVWMNVSVAYWMLVPAHSHIMTAKRDKV